MIKAVGGGRPSWDMGRLGGLRRSENAMIPFNAQRALTRGVSIAHRQGGRSQQGVCKGEGMVQCEGMCEMH